MRLGIVQTIELAVSLAFAAPVGMFAITQLLDGNHTIGAVLLTVAALMVLLPQFITTPGDLPGKALRTVGLGSDSEEERPQP